jgi:hypothetical protein
VMWPKEHLWNFSSLYSSEYTFSVLFQLPL